jgi:regulation of enolase protein 1 (concanavalin A-like superfamily)
MDKGRVRFIEVERNTKDIIDNCNLVIKIHEDNIKKCEIKYNEEITRSKEAIKWAKEELDKLTLE